MPAYELPNAVPYPSPPKTFILQQTTGSQRSPSPPPVFDKEEFKRDLRFLVDPIPHAVIESRLD